MKQITLRLNENGAIELKKIQERLGTKTAQATVEHCLLSYRCAVDEARNFEKKWHDSLAVIDYLEAELKNEREMDAKEYNARKCTKTMTCVCAICGQEIEKTGKTCAAFGIYLCNSDICQSEWRTSQNIIAQSDDK